MKIRFSPYKLIGKPPFKDREGALLQVEFKSGDVGYGDIHPWPELGDKQLSEQMSLLKEGVYTPLTTRSMHFARLDAKARAEKKYLFEDLEIPQSHWLMKFSESIPKSFTTVKIKSSGDVDLHTLPAHVKIRVDFNNKLNYESFSKWIHAIPEFWDRIDFIEDPFPYHKEQWESMPVPLAGDFQEERGKISIVKPAVEDYLSFVHCQKVIITSYLDHPLGQLGAAYSAAMMKKTHPNKIGVCGLLSHTVYEKNAFSERFQNNGPNFVVPKKGTGFGFDDLLEGLRWE